MFPAVSAVSMAEMIISAKVLVKRRKAMTRSHIRAPRS